MSDDAPEPQGFLAILRAIPPGRLVAASLLVSVGALSTPCAGIGLLPLAVGALMLLDSCAYPRGAPVHARVYSASFLAVGLAAMLAAGPLVVWGSTLSPLALLVPPLLGATLSPLALAPIVLATAPPRERRRAALLRAVDLAGAAGPAFVAECAVIGAAAHESWERTCTTTRLRRALETRPG